MTLKRMHFILLSIPLFLIAIGSWLIAQQFDSSANYSKELYEQPFVVSNHSRDIQKNILIIQNIIFDYKTKRSEDYSTAHKKVLQINKKINHSFSVLHRKFLGEKEAVSAFEQKFKKWIPQQKDILVQLSNFNLNVDIARAHEDFNNKALILVGEADSFIAFADSNSDEFFKSIQKNSKFSKTAFVTFCLFLLCIYIVLGATLSTLFERKIRTLSKKIVNVTEKFNGSLDILSSSSLLLSRGTKAQSDRLQSTVSAVTEISSMSQNNAKNTEHSQKSVQHTEEITNQGKKAMESLYKSMKEIEAANEEISSSYSSTQEEFSRFTTLVSEIAQKTSVINEIVFQTKLLSFNAAVEAARAGEHGKGFAVVAEEIANLANLSGAASLEISDAIKESTKHIETVMETSGIRVKSLIENGHVKVESGLSTTERCKSLLDDIYKEVQNVLSLMENIDRATGEQSIGITNITSDIQDLDQLTHGHANNAQRTSQATKELEKYADFLMQSSAELCNLLGDSPTFATPEVYDNNNEELDDDYDLLNSVA